MKINKLYTWNSNYYGFVLYTNGEIAAPLGYFKNNYQSYIQTMKYAIIHLARIISAFLE